MSRYNLCVESLYGDQKEKENRIIFVKQLYYIAIPKIQTKYKMCLN